jgi:hypothetical protein
MLPSILSEDPSHSDPAYPDPTYPTTKNMRFRWKDLISLLNYIRNL